MPKLLLFALAITAAVETVPPARRIEERFLAPCCWRENLAVHRSPEADAMRAELQQLLRSGKSENEIVAFYIARYGQRILREPQGAPALWLKLVPLFAIATGTLLVTRYIVHARRRKQKLIPEMGPGPADEDWLSL